MRQLLLVSSGFRLVLPLYYQNPSEIDAHPTGRLRHTEWEAPNAPLDRRRRIMVARLRADHESQAAHQAAFDRQVDAVQEFLGRCETFSCKARRLAIASVMITKRSEAESRSKK